MNAPPPSVRGLSPYRIDLDRWVVQRQLLAIVIEDLADQIAPLRSPPSSSGLGAEIAAGRVRLAALMAYGSYLAATLIPELGTLKIFKTAVGALHVPPPT